MTHPPTYLSLLTLSVLTLPALTFAADPRPAASPADPVVLVIEAESVPASGWIVERTDDGALLRLTASSPSPLRIPFTTDAPADFALALRRNVGKSAKPARIRIDDSRWLTVPSYGSQPWTWAVATDDDDEGNSLPLSAGAHVIEIKGEAGLSVDRVLLIATAGGAGDLDAETLAARLRAGGVDVAVQPPTIDRDDQGGTVVHLDVGSWLTATESESIIYQWSAPGATSLIVDEAGTQATARFDGGVAEPVQVGFQTLGGVPVFSASSIVGVAGAGYEIDGELKAWHPIQLHFDGPGSNEFAIDPNPFLDFRLNVTFTGPGGKSYTVPGYFDGDGQGGSAGDTWTARFAPDSSGVWSFEASFRQGDNVAIDLAPDAGSPSHFDGLSGGFRVLRGDVHSEGFSRHGRMSYVGEHYLRFPDRTWFIKGGVDSPENFLGYRGFDDIQDMGNAGIIHHYEPHVGDWEPGDPLFVSNSTGYDSKGIIGALNYLSSVGVNSIYFLPMNLGGDGRETCPFVGYEKNAFNKTHYDLSRMRQWAAVLDHAQRKGIKLHIVLAETESGNELWLDEGELGIERKLFFRELVARFGHALGLKWNLCEEADFFTPDDLREHAAYLQAIDAYNHPITIHTFPYNVDDYDQYMGDPLFSASAIQYNPDQAEEHVETWRANSAAAGHKWVLDMDENGPPGSGLTPFNATDLRKRILYDVYFSGGNIEWYMGGSADQGLEDFRTREEMWNYMRHAREFLQENTDFWRMNPADGLLSGEAGDYGGGEVFAEPGRAYAIYLPSANPSGTLDLSGWNLEFEQHWYNPRTGQFQGTPKIVMGGGGLLLGAPPSNADEDWVVWVRKRLFGGLDARYYDLPDGPGSGVDPNTED